jgi:hypothetical protein
MVDIKAKIGILFRKNSLRYLCAKFVIKLYKEVVLLVRLGRFQFRKKIPVHKGHNINQNVRILCSINDSWEDVNTLVGLFATKKIRYVEGKYVYYIPPQNNRWLKSMLRCYPEGVGLKVIKKAGRAEDRIYTKVKGKPMVQQIFGLNSLEMLYSCNFLNTLGITPRIYDLAYMRLNGVIYTAFVVQHIDGSVPSYNDCRRFLKRLDAAIELGILSVNSVKPWYDTTDFACPDCSGNLLADRSCGLFYVDFQNLMVSRRRAMSDVLRSAKKKVHFGREYYVRGRKYPYQSIPDFSIYGKRDTDVRWRAICEMLRKHNLELQEAVVFDVGCNLGMLMAGCLSNGAFWCIGWDKKEVVVEAHRILSLLGYSRYNLYDADIQGKYRFADDVPDHLMENTGSSFLFFLSMRQHVGFPASMFRLPWRYMIYEDHQRESSNIDAYIECLREMVAIDVLHRTSIKDGDTSQRPLLLLERT